MNQKSLFKNSIFLMSYKLLAILFPLITSMYVSRILNAEGVGKVAFAQNIVSYFVVFASLGIPTYGTREIAKTGSNKNESNKVFTELFSINFISTLICLVLYYVMIFSLDKFQNEIILYLVVSISLILNLFNVDWFYQGKEEYVYITVRSFLVKILSLIGLYIFVKNVGDYINYAIISCGAIAINNIFNFFNLHKYIRFDFRNLNLSRHLKFIIVLFSTSIAVELYTQLDTTMIGFIRGEAEVAYYSYAMKLIRIVTSIITAVSTILLPRLSYCFFNKDVSRFNQLCTKAFQVVLTFSIPATIGIYTISNIIIPLLFGKDFLSSIIILKISSPLIIILAIGNLFGSSILVAVGKEKYLFYTTVIGALINLFMNSMLIPSFGANGAAAASVVSELIVMVTQGIYSRKDVTFSISRKFIVSLIISNISMIIILLILDNIVGHFLITLIAKVTIGFVGYILIAFLTKNDTIRWVISQLTAKIKIY